MTNKTIRQQDDASVSAYAATFDPTPAPPTLAVIDSLIDDVGVNTGNVAKDGLTDDLRPTLNGHMDGAEGLVLKVWFNGVQIGTTVVDDNGHWTFTPDTDLAPNQEYYAQVSLLDPGSDAEFMSLPLHFYTTELDQDSNVIPDAATDLHLTDNVGPIQGEITNGMSTDDTTPTFSGKAEAGEVVIISDNGKVIGSVTAAADGTWSFTPELKDGNHSLTTVVENPNTGVTSEPSAAIDFTVDTRAEVPVITGIIDDVGVQQGLVANGGLTDDKQPKLQGTGEPGSTIVITMDGPVSHKTHSIVTLKVGADGHWEYQFTGGQSLQNGNNVFHITETDAAGNQAAGVDYSVNLVASNQDAKVPDAASDLHLTDDVGPIQGEITNGMSTDDTTPTFSGKATPGDVVVISDNGKEIGSVTVPANGNWSYTPSALPEGPHSLAVIVVDPTTGAKSSPTDAIAFTVDTHADAPVITGLYDDVGVQQGLVARGGLTDDNKPLVSGTAEANSTVTVYMKGPGGLTYNLGNVHADAQGNWSLESTTQAMGRTGNWSYWAVAVDEAGNKSGNSDTYIVKFVGSNQDAAAPDAATNIQIYDDVGNVQGYLINGSTTDDNHPTISGQATANDIVLISDNGKVIGSTTVDGKGHWSFTPATALSDAAHSVTVVVKDPISGQSSEATQPFNFVVDTHVDLVSGHEYFEGTYSESADDITFASGLQLSSVGEGDLRVIYSGFEATDPNNSKQTIKGDNHENGISNQSGEGGILFTLPGAAHTISFDYAVAESVTIYDTNHNVIATLTPDYDNGRGTATIGDAVSNEYSWCHFDYTAPQGVAIGSFSVDSGFSWVDNVKWSATDSTASWSQSTDINNEAYNLTNHAHNTLALSYNDVLSHAEQNLYIQDGKEQLAIKGDNGDVVQIKADFGDNAWSNTGSVSAGGVQYDVYQHAGGTVEMLIQHGVELHQVV